MTDLARPTAAQLREPVQSWLSALTPTGGLSVAMASLLIPAGWLLHWPELLVVGVGAAVLVAVAVWWVAGRASHVATVHLERSRVRLGQPVTGIVQTTAQGRTAGERLECPVGADVHAWNVPSLPAGVGHAESFSVITSRRGVLRVGPVRSVRADPWRLLRRAQRHSAVAQVHVHPQVVALTASAPGHLRDIEGVSVQDLSSSDVSFHALRPYLPGDDRRAVHWRTSARTGELMVRQCEETRRSHVAVTLVTNPADDADGFEMAVSVASSVALQAISERRDVSVLTHRGAEPVDSAAALLDAMTTLDPGPAFRTPERCAREVLRDVPGASAMVLVVGASTDPEDLRRAASLVPVDLQCAVVVCGADRDGPRAIGDVAVVDVSELAALPRVWGQVW